MACVARGRPLRFRSPTRNVSKIIGNTLPQTDKIMGLDVLKILIKIAAVTAGDAGRSLGRRLGRGRPRSPASPWIARNESIPRWNPNLQNIALDIDSQDSIPR